MTASTKRQHIVTVTGPQDIKGNWAKMSGGGPTTTASRYTPGGSQSQIVTTGVPTYADISVSREHDVDRDETWLPNMYKLIGREFTITKIFVDHANKVLGKRVYANCPLLTVSEPDQDAESGDVGEVTLTFACPNGPA